MRAQPPESFIYWESTSSILKLIICDVNIYHIYDDNNYVGPHRYDQTFRLLKLLFKSTLNTVIATNSDYAVYKEILLNTNAHKKRYEANGDVRNNLPKFKNIIASLIGYK